ncbi:hypothetical protein [Clostridium rectalis]|nr:hypothetical protein [Clostridium rectalis]
MINFSEDGKLKMYHTIYESIDLELYQYYLLAFYKENINPLKLKIKWK